MRIKDDSGVMKINCSLFPYHKIYTEIRFWDVGINQKIVIGSKQFNTAGVSFLFSYFMGMYI